MSFDFLFIYSAFLAPFPPNQLLPYFHSCIPSIAQNASADHLLALSSLNQISLSHIFYFSCLFSKILYVPTKEWCGYCDDKAKTLLLLDFADQIPFRGIHSFCLYPHQNVQTNGPCGHNNKGVLGQRSSVPNSYPGLKPSPEAKF